MSFKNHTQTHMNALVTTPPEGRFAFPRLSEIVVGRYQQPRTEFEEEALQELAASIKAMGILQPILVRPLPENRLEETFAGRRIGDTLPAYELISGERRWRSSAIAGLDTIPVLIRNLTDAQIPRAQLIENIDREDLTPLELGYAYDRYMKDAQLTAVEVAEQVGCSRTHVYDMLKLLTLPLDVQKAIRKKSVDASAALLIARIPDYSLQAKALSYAITETDGHKPSIRAFQQWLRDNVMLDLEKAPFPIAVKTLTSAGSCEDCSKRTGAKPDLFTDVKSADVCTHPPCYHIKAAAHKDALAALAAKAEAQKERNANVENQHGLGLESTLAQDARANQSADKTADRLKSDIEAIKANLNADIAKATRLATFDVLTDFMKTMTSQASEALLGAHLMRAWLLKLVAWEDNDDVALMLDMPIQEEYDDEFTETCTRRVDAATDGELYVFAATYLLLEERNASRLNSLKPATLMEGFAKDWHIDLRPTAEEVREAAEEEMREKIAAINKQIKAQNSSKSPIPHAPAGAAIDDAAAGAENKGKNKTPAAQARKSKTSTEEAISGIATAMQSIEAEPLDASLGGSEAAAIDSGKLTVGAKVKVMDGKHVYKEGTILNEVGSDMWNISLPGGATGTFSTYLPTKSLEVIA